MHGRYRDILEAQHFGDLAFASKHGSFRFGPAVSGYTAFSEVEMPD